MTSKACYQCRSARRKCIRPKLGECCTPCRRKNKQCSFDLRAKEARHSRSNRSSESHALPQPASITPAGLLDLSYSTTVDLVGKYFRHVHEQAHSVLDPAIVYAQLQDGTFSPAVISVVCAIGARFSSVTESQQLETRLVAHAKRLVQADLETISLENIQACVLLAFISAGNCQTSSEALYLRIAITMAQVLRLDASFGRPHADRRETLGCIMWSLYVIDRWSSSGLGLPRALDHLTQQLSIVSGDEISVDVPPTGNPEWPVGALPTGGLSHMVQLVRLFGPIQDLNRSMAAGEPLNDPDQAVKSIEEQLDAWRDLLPPNMQMTVQNLSVQQQNGQGGPFVALHLTYHHLSMLLFFQDLEKCTSPSLPPSEYAYKCKQHASSFSALLHLARQMSQCHPNYPNIGHMITVSSAVLLHTLLLGSADELERARQELNANFEALLELQKLWPATDAMIMRLMAFQDICMISIDSHKLDGWMVRFLLEHSLGLQKRTLPIISIDMDSQARSITAIADKMKSQNRYTNFSFSRGFATPPGLYT